MSSDYYHRRPQQCHSGSAILEESDEKAGAEASLGSWKGLNVVLVQVPGSYRGERRQGWVRGGISNPHHRGHQETWAPLCELEKGEGEEEEEEEERGEKNSKEDATSIK